MEDLFYGDNRDIMYRLHTCAKEFPLIYADMIYEDLNLLWLWDCRYLLAMDGILIVQTDYHSVTAVKETIDTFSEMSFVNWIIYKQEWGGTPKKGFPQKHDDILIYHSGRDFKWYPDRIQIPKKTAGTAFDKKGTGLKTPCSVWDDLGNFSTMSKERIKMDGKNIPWQKPLKLYDRLFLPFTDTGDTILDPFMGSGSVGVWCKKNGRDYVGIEREENIFQLAKERINHAD